MIQKFVWPLFLVGSLWSVQAQLQHVKQQFTEQDTLRGSITPERAWWDLNYYHLDVTVDPDTKFISGKNTIRYRVLEPHTVLQVDLQPPLRIEKVTQNGTALTVTSKGNAHFVQLQQLQEAGTFQEVVVHYSGHPKEAIRAPWDGGFSWKTHDDGKPFVATSCQGLGASVWWPNKDHMYDEVDSMAISVTVPKELMDVSNGRLRKVTEQGNTKTYHWFVDSPINNYGVNVNLANYRHFGDTYEGEDGPLSLDYYVLPENYDKAVVQFQQVPKMLKAFEHWFGPYPFYADGFKLVEVPYLGMEHQSSVTYGNGYQNGYLGRDLSGTGWGLKFDFIIIHEAGHEWFANNITYKDIADMWIHESFTAYSENLFLDYYHGTEAAADYVIGTRGNISNDRPIIGPYGVNQEGSGDMYYKGANMLHTIRHILQDDTQWRALLRGLNKKFYHQTVTTQQVEDYMIQTLGLDLQCVFDQYLRTTGIPVFEYHRKGKRLFYRFTRTVDGFSMPLDLTVGERTVRLVPTTTWQEHKVGKGPLTVSRHFYVESKVVPPQ